MFLSVQEMQAMLYCTFLNEDGFKWTFLIKVASFLLYSKFDFFHTLMDSI